MSVEKVRKEIERVYALQQANRWRMANTNAEERIARLKRLRKVLWERRREMQQVLTDDFGKAAGETDVTEFVPLIGEINHTIANLKNWVKPVKVKTPRVLFGTRSLIRHEPLGVVLVMAPWNYPVNLLLGPLVAAIAAGNCVMAKPSEKVPRTAGFIADLLADVFPESEVAVFQGGPEVSQALLEKRFDHIFFTGSTRIGKLVMESAASRLTPVTLELGGKSPAIVDDTADVDKAAQRLLWGKFVNAGQTCVAPDYLLIHERAVEPFLAHARRVLDSRYGHSTEQRKQNSSYCRLVDDGHQQRLMELLDRSIKAGAEVLYGGEADGAARYLEPTLVGGIDRTSPLMAEEIFGPILPIITFTHLDQAIEFVRAGEKPLALYVFSESKDNVARVMNNTSSGGACVNTVMIHLGNPELPFGGVGHSGIGNYHGEYGFKTFSHARAVLRQGTPDTLKMFYPPYTDKVTRLIEKAARFMV